MATQYAITVCEGSANYPGELVAVYIAATELEALGKFHDQHHAGAKCRLGGIFKTTHMTIDGTRYHSMPLAWFNS